MLDQRRQSFFLPQMSTKNKCLLTHKQLFSPANHSDCHRQTPFVYENGMSVIFPPAHTDDKNTHTHTHTHKYTLYPRLRYRSATDQLSCWIPNRTYPINLSHTGIEDWYRGGATTTVTQHNSSKSRVFPYSTARIWWKTTRFIQHLERKENLITKNSLQSF